MLVLLTYYKGIFRIKEAVFKTSNIEEQGIRRKASEGEMCNRPLNSLATS